MRPDVRRRRCASSPAARARSRSKCRQATAAKHESQYHSQGYRPRLGAVYENGVSPNRPSRQLALRTEWQRSVSCRTASRAALPRKRRRERIRGALRPLLSQLTHALPGPGARALAAPGRRRVQPMDDCAFRMCRSSPDHAQRVIGADPHAADRTPRVCDVRLARRQRLAPASQSHPLAECRASQHHLASLLSTRAAGDRSGNRRLTVRAMTDHRRNQAAGRYRPVLRHSATASWTLATTM